MLSASLNLTFPRLQDNPPNSTIDSMTNCSSTYSNTHPSLNFSQAVIHGLTGSLDYQGQQLFHGIDLNLQQQQQQGSVPMNQSSPHHSQSLHGQQLSPSANNKIPDIVLTGELTTRPAFTQCAVGRRIDPSWGGPIELFLVPASVPRLV